MRYAKPFLLSLVLVAAAIVGAMLAIGPTRGAEPAVQSSIMPQVDTEAVLRLGDNVQHVSGPGIQGSDEMQELVDVLAGLPADDNGKWYISVVTTTNCPACERLKLAWDSDPKLRALVNQHDHKSSWSHFNVFVAGDPAQDWRWKAIKIRLYPTVIVQPPRSGRFGDPATVVSQRVYDGDNAKLFTAITGDIKKYLLVARPAQAKAKPPEPKSRPVPPEQPREKTIVKKAPGWGASDGLTDRSPPTERLAQTNVAPPWDKPAPAPSVTPGPPANQPQTFPWDEPAQPETPPIPAEPQAIVVVDAASIDDDERELAKRLVSLVKSAPGVKRVQTMSYERAKDLLPVDAGELPAAFLTENGKVKTKISGGLVALLRQPGPAVSPITAISPEVSAALVQTLVPLVADLVERVVARRLGLPQPTPQPSTPSPAPATPATTPQPGPDVPVAPTPAPGGVLGQLNPWWLTAFAVGLPIVISVWRRLRQTQNKPQLLTDDQISELKKRLQDGSISTDDLAWILNLAGGLFAQRMQLHQAVQAKLTTINAPESAPSAPPAMPNPAATAA